MEPVKEVQVTMTRRIPQVEHVCPVCGTTFFGARLAVYCGVACRKKAAWQKHGKKYNANRKKKGEGN